MMNSDGIRYLLIFINSACFVNFFFQFHILFASQFHVAVIVSYAYLLNKSFKVIQVFDFTIWLGIFRFEYSLMFGILVILLCTIILIEKLLLNVTNIECGSYFHHIFYKNGCWVLIFYFFLYIYIILEFEIRKKYLLPQLYYLS